MTAPRVAASVGELVSYLDGICHLEGERLAIDDEATFRASGISAYLENGGTLEHAQAIAGHWSTRATLLYARARNPIPAEEVERITI